MKKILLICMLLLAIVVTIAACTATPPDNNDGSENDTPVHTHNFGEWDFTLKPTCTIFVR